MERTVPQRRSKTPLVVTVALSLLFVLGSGSAAYAQPLTQISSDPYTNPDSNHKTQVEPDTFSFGNTIVATFQSGRFFDGGATNIGWSTSTNGGATWTHGFLPDSTVNGTDPGPYPRASDPSVAYDAKHKVWLISWIGLVSVSGGINDVLVSRSTDGGLTFGPPVVVHASGTFLDKNWTVCDDTSTSPFYGHCYTEFDNFSNLNEIQMSTSTNGGSKWAAPKTTPDHTCVIGGQPLVQPDGTVIVPIDDCTETAIFSVRSTDGGNSWQRPVLVAQVLNDGHPGSIRAPDLPTAEIDHSGRVYVVWADCRFEAACTAPIGTNDLLLTSSTNGVDWTLPSRIPTAGVGSGADFLIPGLGVDRTTSGHLGLAYYYFPDSTCTVNTCSLNVGFVSSVNGGGAWSSPDQLAGPMTVGWLPLTTQGFMVGDYISTSITPGEDATPAFMVAKPPTPGPTCSDTTSGAPGSGCDQATYTTQEDQIRITGGTNAATTRVSAPSATPSRPTLRPPGTAFLRLPGTAF